MAKSAQISAPITPAAPLVLPWPCLCADNHRLMWVYGQARLSTPYRRAKAQVEQRARLWWRNAQVLSVPVVLVGRFWFPDLRQRDAGNYRKLLTDALSQIAYADDALVHDERWIRVGLDRVNPRCELSLEVLAAADAA